MNTPKKIFYIFHGRFPSEKAASIFAAKSVEALVDAGREVVMLVPRRLGCTKLDPYAYYGIKKNFTTIYIPTIDLFHIPFFAQFAFFVSYICFSLGVFVYLFFRAERPSLVYSNESLPLIVSSFVFKHLLYEVHDFPDHARLLNRFLLKRTEMVLVTNTWKKEKMIEQFGLVKDHIIVEPNAVDVDIFDIDIKKEDARLSVDLPTEKSIVMYTGHLYSWKGVDTLAKAASFLPDVLFVFVGGTVNDVEKFKDRYEGLKNILIVGHKPYKEISVWQKAADILVLPNTAKELISLHYTSPMKLFEYMCSRRPIIASNIPSLTELLNGTNAEIVEPDDPAQMAKGIDELLSDVVKMNTISSRAYGDVLTHSWSERAKRILGFIDKMM
jgi:glycosyltransferase involved in cell wall biosynthesis